MLMEFILREIILKSFLKSYLSFTQQREFHSRVHYGRSAVIIVYQITANLTIYCHETGFCARVILQLKNHATLLR